MDHAHPPSTDFALDVEAPDPHRDLRSFEDTPLRSESGSSW
jgi:hypothetical protein